MTELPLYLDHHILLFLQFMVIDSAVRLFGLGFMIDVGSKAGEELA